MEIIRVSPRNLKTITKKAAQTIRTGGTVVCPTDTVYGLIANATNEKALKKIFKIKKRTFKKPVPVFVKSIKTARRLVYIDARQEKFLKKVWPGKVTVVLKTKSAKLPSGILNKDKEIGLRIPDYKLLNSLLEKVNIPLVGTSANISGKKASTKIKEVLKQFKKRKHQPDLILDAGNLKPSLLSTVIDLINLKIIRRGEIPQKEIFKIVKK